MQGGKWGFFGVQGIDLVGNDTCVFKKRHKGALEGKRFLLDMTDGYWLDYRT